MSRPIITLTTDFGTDDSYVAQMKGVILGINPAATIVDVTHAVAPQNIAAGATVLEDTVDAFPDGTIHLAVVDPGVGSDRELVAVEMGRWRFVAPDNGLLHAVARRYPPRRIVRLEKSEYLRNPVSRTFHGRDILAPVAAHWSLDVDASLFGGETSSLATIPLPRASRSGRLVTGEVARIDRFGNVVTSIGESLFDGEDRGQLQVECNGWAIVGLSGCYADAEPGAVIALVGSSGRVELAQRDGSAAAMLNAPVGTPVHIRLQSGES
jgi:S-adenosylmethionine hydrolase